MAKQPHGGLQNVSQSSINQPQHFIPALENAFFYKFGWFLQQNISLGGAQELGKGLCSISSSTGASSCIPGHGDERREDINSLLAAHVEG